MQSDVPVLIPMPVQLWRTAGSFKKLATNIQNGTFVQPSCMARSGSIRYTIFAVCVPFVVTRTHSNDTTISSDFILEE